MDFAHLTQDRVAGQWHPPNTLRPVCQPAPPSLTYSQGNVKYVSTVPPFSPRTPSHSPSKALYYIKKGFKVIVLLLMYK